MLRAIITLLAVTCGCRTGEEFASRALGHQGPPPKERAIATVSGPSAETLYENFHVEERLNGTTGEKQQKGELKIVCVRAKRHDECRFGTDLALDGNAARDFFDGFNLPTTIDQENRLATKTYSGKGVIRCSFSGTDYTCSVRAIEP